jgi:hypothetical protein
LKRLLLLGAVQQITYLDNKHSCALQCDTVSMRGGRAGRGVTSPDRHLAPPQAADMPEFQTVEDCFRTELLISRSSISPLWRRSGTLRSNQMYD